MSYKINGAEVLNNNADEQLNKKLNSNQLISTSGYHLDSISLKNLVTTDCATNLSNNCRWVQFTNRDSNNSYKIDGKPFKQIAAGSFPSDLNAGIYEASTSPTDNRDLKRSIYVSFNQSFDENDARYFLSFCEVQRPYGSFTDYTIKRSMIKSFSNYNTAIKRLGIALTGAGGGASSYFCAVRGSTRSMLFPGAGGGAGDSIIGVLNLDMIKNITKIDQANIKKIVSNIVSYATRIISTKSGYRTERYKIVEQVANINQAQFVAPDIYLRFRIDLGNGGKGAKNYYSGDDSPEFDSNQKYTLVMGDQGNNGEDSEVYLEFVTKKQKDNGTYSNVTTQDNFNNWDLIKQVKILSVEGGRGGTPTKYNALAGIFIGNSNSVTLGQNGDCGKSFNIPNYKVSTVLEYPAWVSSIRYSITEDLIWVGQNYPGKNWIWDYNTPKYPYIEPEKIKLYKDFKQSYEANSSVYSQKLLYPTFSNVYDSFDEVRSKSYLETVTADGKSAFGTTVRNWYDYMRKNYYHNLNIPGGRTPFGHGGGSINYNGSQVRVNNATYGSGGGCFGSIGLDWYSKSTEDTAKRTSSYSDGAGGYVKFFY